MIYNEPTIRPKYKMKNLRMSDLNQVFKFYSVCSRIVDRVVRIADNSAENAGIGKLQGNKVWAS